MYLFIDLVDISNGKKVFDVQVIHIWSEIGEFYS